MRLKIENHRTAAECFDDFILYKKGRGIADKTLKSYADHFHAAGKYIDWNTPIEKIGIKEINAMIAALRDRQLAPRTIATYVVAVKTFFSWAQEEGLSRLNVPLYKCEDSVKETYTDDELRLALEKAKPPQVRFQRIPQLGDYQSAAE